MSMTDPIADMLVRIRNAASVGKPTVIMPSSKTKVAIAKVLQDYQVDFSNKCAATYPSLEHCAQYRETDFAFVSRLMERGTIEVAAGTTVTWRNQDALIHTVTAVDKKSFQDAIMKTVTLESMGYQKSDWDKIQAIK